MHHAKNQAAITPSALFYGQFHVLMWVQQVCLSQDKVPEKATMSRSASFALNTIDLLTNPDEAHYIGRNGPAKVFYFSQLALESQQN